jgi:HK97 family phage prohead protease
MTNLHKQLDLAATNFKFSSEGALTFKGYASVFGGIDSHGDTIQKGAYQNTLENRERPILLRWNHEGPVIGKYTNIYEDDYGLYVEGELSKGHSVADDVSALMKHGSISGLSIGYSIIDSEPLSTGGKLLKEIYLKEISVVEEPSDNSARITDVKSALKEVTEFKQIEAILRDKFGLSRQESTAIVSAVNSLKKQSDSENKQSALVNQLKAFQDKI